MNNFVNKLILTALLLVLSGCGGEEKFKPTTTLEKFREIQTMQQIEDAAQNVKLPLLSDADAVVGEYLLGSGDLLVIKVFETEKLDTEVRVSSRGIINVPLIGDVNVMDKSVAEVEQLIEDLYRQEYLHDPHVSVYIKEHISRQITLVGAVENPGTYEYVAQKRLLDVLAIGNGLKKDAGSFAYITREDPHSKKRISYMVDLDDLVINGNMENNYIILGGDVVFVPEAGQCFVDGAVRKPGTYPLENNMTITEAIAIAGGLAGYADDDKIKLIRFMGRGKERQVVSLSYNDLQAGIGDTLLLKDQDIVFAESSISGKLFSGTGFTLGFLGTGVTFKDPQQ